MSNEFYNRYPLPWSIDKYFSRDDDCYHVNIRDAQGQSFMFFCDDEENLAEMIVSNSKARYALSDLLTHAVDAWDETDIDGPYQTKAFREAIKRAEEVFKE